ncbi:hypothetical protein CVM50_07275 [Pseudooceanicola marinus]|nr:hypothetical protein CVM50_07275 [Pseudooceanicola marinus]
MPGPVPWSARTPSRGSVALILAPTVSMLQVICSLPIADLVAGAAQGAHQAVGPLCVLEGSAAICWPWVT